MPTLPLPPRPCPHPKRARVTPTQGLTTVKLGTPIAHRRAGQWFSSVNQDVQGMLGQGGPGEMGPPGVSLNPGLLCSRWRVSPWLMPARLWTFEQLLAEQGVVLGRRCTGRPAARSRGGRAGSREHRPQARPSGRRRRMTPQLFTSFLRGSCPEGCHQADVSHKGERGRTPGTG